MLAGNLKQFMASRTHADSQIAHHASVMSVNNDDDVGNGMLDEAQCLVAFEQTLYQCQLLTNFKTDVLRSECGEALVRARCMMMSEWSDDMSMSDLMTLNDQDREALSISDVELVVAGICSLSSIE